MTIAGERCRLCESDRLDVVCDHIRGDIPCSVLRCGDCGLVFLPRAFFDPERLRQQYEQNYDWQPNLSGLEATAASPYLRRVERIASLLDPERTELLEIGSGFGYFLEAVRPRVKSVVGQELNRKQAQHCRDTLGIEILAEAVDEIPAGRKFDMVCLFQVLEHATDPVALARAALRLVRPGGLLYLDVPSVNDALLAVHDVPGYDRFWFRPLHLMNFDHRTLAEVLTRAGAGEVDVRYVQNYSLTNHLHWAATGKPQPNLNVGMRPVWPAPLKGPAALNAELEEMMAEADRRYRDILIRHGFGDMLYALARKKPV